MNTETKRVLANHPAVQAAVDRAMASIEGHLHDSLQAEIEDMAAVSFQAGCTSLLAEYGIEGLMAGEVLISIAADTLDFVVRELNLTFERAMKCSDLSYAEELADAVAGLGYTETSEGMLDRVAVHMPGGLT